MHESSVVELSMGLESASVDIVGILVLMTREGRCIPLYIQWWQQRAPYERLYAPTYGSAQSLLSSKERLSPAQEQGTATRTSDDCGTMRLACSRFSFMS